VKPPTDGRREIHREGKERLHCGGLGSRGTFRRKRGKPQTVTWRPLSGELDSLGWLEGGERGRGYS